jgi:hydrogenase/urease accessory protein HupE
MKNFLTLLLTTLGILLTFVNPIIGAIVALFGTLFSFALNRDSEFDMKLSNKIMGMKQQYNSGISISDKNDTHLYWIGVCCSEKEIERAIKLNLIPENFSIKDYPNNSNEEIKKLNKEKWEEKN